MRRWLVVLYLSTYIFNYVSTVEKNKNDSAEESESDIVLNKKEDNNSRDEVNKEQRTLVAGDIFTPQEMLPIATKLLEKVEEPGNGKGFVSSTKSPKELADKLFEAFFLKDKRIVTLKDYDIIGIDALQALALSGEDADEFKVEATPEAVTSTYLRGQFVDVKSKPRKSQYKLVTKTVDSDLNTAKRRGIPLVKKLSKKRHLVVNKRRSIERKEKKTDKNDTGNVKQENNKSERKVRPTRSQNRGPINDLSNNVEEKSNPKKTRNCQWKYVCDDMADLDTCRLEADCSNEKSKSPIDNIVVKHKSDEHTLAIKQFRKMLGISIVDEEVEKILESRNLHLNPVSKDALNRVESLSEYFNNIIVLENLESTTALQSQLLTGVEGLKKTKSRTKIPDSSSSMTSEEKSRGRGRGRGRGKGRGIFDSYEY